MENATVGWWDCDCFDPVAYSRGFALTRSGWIFIATIPLLSALAAVVWKEAHPDWREWQTRYNAQTGISPVSRQIRVLTPTRTGQPELCLTCHTGIEEISASHPTEAFGCVICHGGEPMALDKRRAHSTMRGGRNPSDLSVAAQSCGQSDCHGGYADEEQNHVDRVLKSIQSTYAGGIAHIRYSFGLQSTPDARLGIHATVDSVRPLPPMAIPSLQAFSPRANAIASKIGNCLTRGCHLQSLPQKPQQSMYRSSGCAACHYPYADDGLYRGKDATIPRDQPGHGMVHRFTTALAFTQCNHCHNRGNYSLKTMSFDSRDDLPPARRPISGQVSWEGRRLIEYYQPIGRFARCEYELDCVDCHTGQEAMGDGHIYGSKKDVQYIQCQTCHGTRDAKPGTAEIRQSNELAMRRARMNGLSDCLKIGDRVVETSRGELLWSVKGIAPDEFVQIGKVSGKVYQVPLVMGSQCKQDGKTQTSDHCHQCHSVSK
jgi:hypothetical protein